MHNIYFVKTSGIGDEEAVEANADKEAELEAEYEAMERKTFERQKQTQIENIFKFAQEYMAAAEADNLTAFEKGETQRKLWISLTQAMYKFYTLVYERGTDRTITDQFVKKLLDKMRQVHVPLEDIEKTMDLLWFDYYKETLRYKKRFSETNADKEAELEAEYEAMERKTFERQKQTQIENIFKFAQEYMAAAEADNLTAFEKGETQRKLWISLTQAMYKFYTLVYERGTDRTITDQFVKKLLDKMRQVHVPLEDIEKTMDLLWFDYYKETLRYKKRFSETPESKIANKKKTNYAAWVHEQREAAKATTHHTLH